MKNCFFLFFSITVFLSISIGAGCFYSTHKMENPEKKTHITFTEEDDGRSVKLNRGEVFDIMLEGNPTTGYTWQKTEPEDRDILELIEREFKPQSDRIGSPGIQIFHFKAVGKGRTTIRLIYHRPWEKEVQPLREFELRISIKRT